MNIHLPKNKGIPINPFPIDDYDHVFECVTINCEFTLTVQIKLVRIPNKIALWERTDWAWRCPKCDVAQIARGGLPESIPLTEHAKLRTQGGENGAGQKKKRKRNPKKKEKDNDESENNIE